MGDKRLTPEGVPVYNFAFDVTPAELITGIITEKGVLQPPYGLAIWAALNEASAAPDAEDAANGVDAAGKGR